MDLRIIKSPSKGTKQIIQQRISGRVDINILDVDAIGLVQGKMIDMLCASDIAEKAVGVDVYDLKGLCPQHMTMLALFGDTASVLSALSEIEKKISEGVYSDYSQTY